MAAWARPDRTVRILLVISLEVCLQIAPVCSIIITFTAGNADDEEQVLGILVHENLYG